MKRLFIPRVLYLLLVTSIAFADALPVKVMVLTAFPPELAPWVKHIEHPSLLNVAGAYAPVWCDARAVCVTETGKGQVNAATTVSALLASDSLDLNHAVVLRAGDAGGPPWGDVTVGGAYWSDWVVSWDLGHHLPSLSQGQPEPRFLPRRANKPPLGTAAFHLNPALVNLAYDATRRTPLADDASARRIRAQYPGHAGRVPNIAIGATVTGDDFWVDAEYSRVAQQIVDYYTHGEARYLTTAMEDTGDAGAMARRGLLAHYLSLRAISDFDQPPSGQTAAAMLLRQQQQSNIAFENAYRVGGAFVEYALAHPQAVATAMAADNVPVIHYPLTAAEAMGD